jgi:predicted Zn-dependent protease
MRHNLVVTIIAAFVLGTAINVLGVSYDYYDVSDPGVQNYMKIVESAHINKIPTWLSQGRYDNAVADVEYALERFPNHPLALQYAAMIAQMTKRTAWANKYFDLAVSSFPSHAITRAQYGLYLVAIGNVDSAIAKLQVSIEMDPKLTAGYVGLAQAYTKKADLPQAREAAKTARELGYTGKLPEGL